MKHTMKSEILGLVDAKNSYISMIIEDMFVGNKRYLSVSSSVKITPNKDLVTDHALESFSIKLSIDNQIIFKDSIEVNLAEGIDRTFENDIEMNNSQLENRIFKLELDDIKTNKIDYTSINEMISIEPVNNTKAFIRLDYYKRGATHSFNYSTHSADSRVYMKMNNNSWKEIHEGFTLKDDELEGAVNYIQLYTTDDENNKIYSNTVRFVKS